MQYSSKYVMRLKAVLSVERCLLRLFWSKEKEMIRSNSSRRVRGVFYVTP